MDEYVAACRKEIVAAAMRPAATVFFGGGTPSLIPAEQLASILSQIELEPGAEVTVECNPDNVTPELMRTYANAGVNRISLGVQSMNTHVLRALGRDHDQANVQYALRCAVDAGIERINADIIYGGAGESVEDWRQTVESVLALDPRPTHVSAYALTIEAGTPLAKDAARHPDDDDQATKYEIVDDLLTRAGMVNYEISNWALPGDECRHNVLYWQQHDYRGIGCAAHSHEKGRRWWNLRTPERYIAAVQAGMSTEAAGETLDEATRRFEKLELQLRMNTGVPAEALPVEELVEFLDVRDGRAILNRRGRLMANEIALRLVTS